MRPPEPGDLVRPVKHLRLVIAASDSAPAGDHRCESLLAVTACVASCALQVSECDVEARGS